MAGDVPLIIAVHGGTYTSEYFDIPGHSLLDQAAALGIPIVAVDRPGYRGSSPVEQSDSIILKNAEVSTMSSANSGRRGAKPRRGPSSSLIPSAVR